METVENIEEFLVTHPRWPTKAWVRIPRFHCEVYLSNAKRLHPCRIDVTVQSLEICNVVVANNFRKQGHARALYKELVETAAKHGMMAFIENSNLPFMTNMHLRNGFLPYTFSPACYYKLPVLVENKP